MTIGNSAPPSPAGIVTVSGTAPGMLLESLTMAPPRRRGIVEKDDTRSGSSDTDPRSRKEDLTHAGGLERDANHLCPRGRRRRDIHDSRLRHRFGYHQEVRRFLSR